MIDLIGGNTGDEVITYERRSVWKRGCEENKIGELKKEYGKR